MDKFNREAQRSILQLLYNIFPEELTDQQFNEIFSYFSTDNHSIANLLYLESHGLICSGLKNIRGGYGLVNRPSITHKGIDFIRDDGGLVTILNVQTIKYYNNIIIALEDIIRIANLPEEKTSGLIAQLRELPADAIKHLTLQLLTPEVLHPQSVIQSIEKFLQSM